MDHRIKWSTVSHKMREKIKKPRIRKNLQFSVMFDFSLLSLVLSRLSRSKINYNTLQFFFLFLHLYQSTFFNLTFCLYIYIDVYMYTRGDKLDFPWVIQEVVDPPQLRIQCVSSMRDSLFKVQFNCDSMVPNLPC